MSSLSAAGTTGWSLRPISPRPDSSPLVLERRPTAGGCAITEEFHPGFRCSTLAHSAGPIRSDIVGDMGLLKHGLKTYSPEVRVLSLSSIGKPLALYSDTAKSQQAIAKFSQRDAASYAEFAKSLGRIGEVIDLLLAMTPPDLDDPASGNLWELLKAGRKLRGLGEKDLYRLLRWGPMAIADLVAEWFDVELLRGTIAAQGIFGTFLGPWSAGSTATYLLRTAEEGNPAGHGILHCRRHGCADRCHGGGRQRGWGRDSYIL